MRRVLLVGLLALAAGAFAAPAARATDLTGALVSDVACTQTTLPRNDDGFSAAVQLPFGLNFYGQDYDRLWVNNNGNVTFDGPMSTYTPFTLRAAGRAIIAPFFGDVDTRGAGSDPVRYGYGETVYEGHRAFCADWIDVVYYSFGTDKLNSFQLLLVDRGDVAPGDFDIVFDYGSLRWEAGSASGGRGGLGGSSARVGFANGDGSQENSFELDGSGVNGRLLDDNPLGLIHGSLGSNQLGRYVWRVRGGRPRANRDPVADAGADRTVTEGDVARLDAGNSSDPDSDPLSFRWQRLRGTGPAAVLSSSAGATPSFEALDDASADFRVTVDDGKGGTATDEVSVRTVNAPPAVSAAGVAGSQGGASVLSATFSDPGVLDRHTATIDWGDGTDPQPASVTDGSGWGTLVAAHRYARAGSYTAHVEVADDDGGTGEASAAVTIGEPAGIWASSATATPALSWSGSDSTIAGLVHSNSDLKVTGSRNRVDGTTEYAGTLKLGGSANAFSPEPRAVDAAESPLHVDVADYRPGGRAAREAGASYFDESEACRRDGTWVVDRNLAPGVHYAPCAVHIAGDELTGEVTIVSEDAIELSGSRSSLRAYMDGVLLLAGHRGDGALHVSGSSLQLAGYLVADRGELHVSGAKDRIACGLQADTIRLTGSSDAFTAADCTRPAGAVALSTLVPSPRLGVDVDRGGALPGDQLTYRATLTNAGATLVASGLMGAQDTGTDPATVASYAYELQYRDADGAWTTLASAAGAQPGYTPREPLPSAGGVRLAVQPMSSPGVTYAGGQDPLGATLSPGALAAWGYQARLDLTPAQVKLLEDPARATAVRNVVHLELTGSSQVRELYRLGGDFAARLRLDSGALDDATVTIAPPAGDPTTFGAADVPALAGLAPGASATATLAWRVPALPARGESEPSAAYVARLRAADGAALRGAARARGHSGGVRLPLPQTTVTSVRHVPLLALDKSGPDTLRAGDPAAYDLRIHNAGSAQADAVAVTDDATGRGAVAVSGVPPALDPGADALGRASFPTPAGVFTPVTDRGAVTWKDANGNAYGPVDDTVTTRMTAPGSLTATMEDRLEEDADGDGAVSPGDVVGYEIVVANSGTSGVGGVDISAPVDPASAVVAGSVAASDGQVVRDGGDGTVEVAVGTLGGRRSTSVRYRVRVADPLPRGTTQLRTQAHVTNSSLPEVLSDDLKTATRDDPTLTPVHARTPRLAASLTAELQRDADGDGQPSPGDTLRYTLAIANDGDARATGVVATAHPGDNTELVSDSVTAQGGTVVPAGTDASAAFDAIEGHASARMTFDARVAAQLPQGVTSVGAQASVASHELPAVSAAITTALHIPPHLVAEQSSSLLDDRDGNGAVSPGDRLRYTVHVANESDGPASGVELRFALDPSTTLVAGSVTTTQGTASGDGGTISAQLGDLPARGEATVTFDADLGALADGQHQVVSQGSVTGDGLPPTSTDDPNAPGGGDATVTPVVSTSGPPPALVLTKRDSLAVDADGNGVPSPGDTLSYELHLWNSGAGAATSVALEDTPGAHTTLVAGSVQSASGGTVESGNAPGDDSARVRLGEVPAASGATVTFQARVDTVLPAGTLSVSNQARAVSAELAPVPSFDPDTASPGGATVTRLTVPPAAPPAIGEIGPADGSVITAPVPVRASLEAPAGQRIESYCVRVARTGEEAARTLRCADGAPDGDLAQLDPTLLPNGTYTITVEATASGGGVQRQTSTVTVEGKLKLGRYTTSYQDMGVVVGGLPVRLRRSYDSFEKSSGDFGVGWSLDLADVRIQSNRALGGGGWSDQPSGCLTLLGQSVCLSRAFRDLSSHYVTVTWPDGRTEAWDFTPVAGSGGIYFDATATFTPRPGTTSTLVPEGDPTLQYWGDGNLYEADGETLYDPHRFVLTAKDGRRYVLDTESGLVSTTDAHGATLTVDHDGIHSSDGASLTFMRDAQDRITRIDGPSGERRTYGYSPAGDLISVTDAAGKSATYEYDAEHDLTSANDPDGRPLRTLHYDDAGRLVAVTDAAGHTVRIDSDVDARREVVTSASGELTTIAEHDEQGNVTALTEVADGRSRTTRYEYDANGNRTKTTDPLGHVTTATYDAAGDLTSATDADGRTTTLGYDAAHRLTKVTEPDGTVSEVITRNEAGDPVTVDHGGGRVTRYEYDPQGRLSTTSDAAGHTTRISYDDRGNVARVQDAGGGTASFTYDASDRLASQTDAQDGTTRFQYDADGRLVEQTGARGDVRKWTYDGLGRVVAETDADGHSRTYAYDDAGRLASTTDRNGRTTTFDYDADGRVTKATLPSGATIDRGYDGFGRLTSAVNDDAKVTLAYDDASRLTNVTTSGVPGSDQPTTSVDYGYDAAGLRTTTATPWGTSTAGYDGLGELATLTDPAGGGEFRFERDALGRPSRVVRPNGVTTATSYDLADQVTDVVSVAAGGAVVDEQHLSYDAAGLPEHVTDHFGTSDYGFDTAGRLTSASHPDGVPDESYGYDAAGNRTSNGESYDPAGRLLGDRDATYEYDLEGRETARIPRAGGGATRYEWDALGRLRKTTDAQGRVTTYRYDPLGRRIEVAGPRGVVRYAYGAEDQPLATFDAANHRTATFLSGPYLDTPLAIHRGGTALYPLQDAGHDVAAVTDATGRVVERYRYGAFGQPAGVPDEPQSPFTFAGREWDPAAGAYYVRARDYDPATGRFLSEDPRPAFNQYVYGHDNPLTEWDPSGEMATSLSEVEATEILANDLEAAEAGAFERGFVYRFVQAMRAEGDAAQQLYVGITRNMSQRAAAHGARVAEWVDQIEVEVTSRIQLRALEQARILARGGVDELANKINAMSMRNWEAVGRELVERWAARNPDAPAELMDDIAAALAL